MLGLTVLALAAGCSSKEERAARKAEAELKQAREDAIEAFDNAKYPVAAEIASRDLDEAHAIVAAASSNGLDVRLGPMPASEQQAAAEGMEGQTPAEPAPPEVEVAKYAATCADYLQTSRYVFDARCRGRQVSGKAQVEYSYPETGTMFKIGAQSYRINFREPAPPRLLHGELVSVNGKVGAKTHSGDYPELDDVTVQRLPVSGSPQQLRLLKLSQLGELCLDLANESDTSRIKSKLTEARYLKKGALHPTLANSGSVEVEGHFNEYNDRCIIENNRIKIAQRGVKAYDEDAKEYVAWEDRGAVLAKLAAWSKQHDIDRAAELKARIDEYKSLPTKDKAARMLGTLMFSAEAISEAIPTDPVAQGYLELCNVATADGLRAFKEQGIVGPYERAARTCSTYASKICTPDRRTRACTAYHDKAYQVVSTMIDAQ